MPGRARPCVQRLPEGRLRVQPEAQGQGPPRAGRRPLKATPPTADGGGGVSSKVEMNGVVPNGGPGQVVMMLTPHDQRRRAALLADSPELSTRPPLNAGGGSGSVLGVLQEAHTQMSNTGSSSSTTSSIHRNYGFDHGNGKVVS